jgi:hypothetical protein
MGIHDVDLPPREAEHRPAFDLDFNIDDLPKPESAGAESPAAPPKREAPAAAPPVVAAPSAPSASSAAVPPSASFSVTVADDFAQLLAYEQGEQAEPPSAPAPEVRIVAPEITPAMLDEIAARVADRLSAGSFGETLRSAMATTVRDTVRSVVSETSERLVREEIDRIKNKKA